MFKKIRSLFELQMHGFAPSANEAKAKTFISIDNSRLQTELQLTLFEIKKTVTCPIMQTTTFSEAKIYFVNSWMNGDNFWFFLPGDQSSRTQFTRYVFTRNAFLAEPRETREGGGEVHGKTLATG